METLARKTNVVRAWRGLSPASPGRSQRLVRAQRTPESWIGFGFSLGLHLVLLLIFAAWLLAPGWDNRSLSINSALTDHDELDMLNAADFELPKIVAADEPQDAAAELPKVVLDAIEVPDTVGDSQAAQLASLTPMAADQLAGGGGGAGFFGAEGRGNSFVFIVDCSGSMGQGRRFTRAIRELNNSIGRLSSSQSFFVIFYSDNAVPLFDPTPEPRLLPATRSNRKKAQEWNRGIRPAGGTEPLEAFKMALALKPEVIFFLTDGAIQDEQQTREQVRENNLSETVVHTIALCNKEGERLLQAIARENHGRYRYVD